MAPKRPAFDYAAQWDDTPETTELTLPSGKKIVVTNPDLPTLAKHGAIPNHLIGIVERYILDSAEALRQTSPDEDVQLEPGERLTRLADFHLYLQAFAVAAAVDPKLSFDGRPGTTNVSRLDSLDAMHIWNWGRGVVEPVATFPGDAGGAVQPVGSLPDGAGVRDAAGEPAGAVAAD